MFARLLHLGEGVHVEAHCLDVEFRRDAGLLLLLRPVRGSGVWWHDARDAEVCKASPGDNPGEAIPLKAWEPRAREEKAQVGGAPPPMRKVVVLPQPDPGPT